MTLQVESKVLVESQYCKNIKIKLPPARELDFQGPRDPKVDPKSVKIGSKLNQGRLKSLLGAVLE